MHPYHSPRRLRTLVVVVVSRLEHYSVPNGYLGMMTLSSNNGMKGMYLTEREAAELAARAKAAGTSIGSMSVGEVAPLC